MPQKRSEEKRSMVAVPPPRVGLNAMADPTVHFAISSWEKRAYEDFILELFWKTGGYEVCTILVISLTKLVTFREYRKFFCKSRSHPLGAS